MAELSVQQAIDLVGEYFRAANWPLAEQLCQRILQAQPRQADALHFLGLLAHRAKNYHRAVQFFNQALAARPNWPAALCNLGASHQELHQFDQAIAAQHRALALAPDNPRALNNLGNCLTAKGQLAEAIDSFNKSLALRPNDPLTLNNLGVALQRDARLTEALEAFSRSASLAPGFPPASANLGHALRQAGRVQEAVDAYRRAIAIDPKLVEVQQALCDCLFQTSSIDDVLATAVAAVVANPASAPLLRTLSRAQHEAGRLDEALTAAQKAITLEPDSAEAHNLLGNCLKDAAEIEPALAAYEQALRCDPTYSPAHSSLIFSLFLDPRASAADIAARLKYWDAHCVDPLRRSPAPHLNRPDPERPLRIGYVSADFTAHASMFFLTPLLQNHDQEQFEIFCYSNTARREAFVNQMLDRVRNWRDISCLSDDRADAMIREDQIDLLVDLKLHTAENRLMLFARKPAPVQATWLGYPGTTGLREIDYRLSDPYLDPIGIDESVYAEKTLRLPETFWCYEPLDGRAIEVVPLPAQAVGHITFGCLNTFAKINSVIISLWAQILERVTMSRLILLAHPGRHRDRTLEQFAARRIGPDRIEFADFRPRRQYLELYHRIDITLDSFPCNGHTTSLDSLWMGVPVVSLTGKTTASRAGFSQLSNLGLPDLATELPADYVDIATKLAQDTTRLSHLRRTLRDRMLASPLMDATRFARNMESAYRRMWRQWCETRAPAV
jgi:predicted O-linked N-acetylglucosamine transferase (SPINDLY family)